jgi:hypothetical protein
MTENSDFAAQVRKLRTDVFLIKCIAGVLILCVAALIVAGQIKHSKVLEATQLVLKDDAGKVIAMLGKGGFGSTCLSLSAKENAAIAELCADGDGGGYLDLHNLRTESRVTLTPGFTMYEPLAHFPAGLLIEKDSNKHFLNLSLGEETKLVIGHGANDSIIFSSPAIKPAITLFNGDGKEIWSTH